MHKKGFDTNKYLEEQTKRILERVSKFEKLYLEFGGKLCYDMHASRVLPGYRPTCKIELLKKLGDLDIIVCVSAIHIEKGKIRGDSGLTYDNQTLKDINDIRNFGLDIKAVVITMYTGQKSSNVLKQKLEHFGIKVYLHKPIKGYPLDIENALAGFLEQPYIETSKKLIVVTGAGPNSCKMATCLSQIYHERKKGHNTAFAKFETFPIWNLPLNHEVNTAYEAATADLMDANMIDTFHKKEYGKDVVNYNRDIENFSILISIMKKITGETYPFGYKSPTDMGVNMAASGIIDDEACREASKQEIIRRYFKYYKEKVEGTETQETIDQIKRIMEKVKVVPEDRRVVEHARKTAAEAEKQGKGFENIYCGVAIELKDGRIVTGKNSPMLHAESAAILNAVKEISSIPDGIDLLSSEVIINITNMKRNLLGKATSCLSLNETLIALAMSSGTNPVAKTALNALKELENCEMHITHLPTKGDETGLMQLKMNVTTDARLSVLGRFD